MVVVYDWGWGKIVEKDFFEMYIYGVCLNMMIGRRFERKFIGIFNFLLSVM